MSYQQLILIGNVGKQPELKYLPSGDALCSFSLAVNEKWGQGENRREKTTWFRITAWGPLAETCMEYVTSGKQLMVVGTIEGRAYTNNAGEAACSLEVRAREVKFLGSRDQGSGDSEPAAERDRGGRDDIPF